LSRDHIGEFDFYENYIKSIKDPKKRKALYQQSLMHPYLFTNNSQTNYFDEFRLALWTWAETVIEAAPVIGTVLNLFVTPPREGDVTMIVGGASSAKLSAGMSLAFVVGEVDSIVNLYAYIDNVEEIWDVAIEAKNKYCRDKQ
jgi:hypothetical protein